MFLYKLFAELTLIKLTIILNATYIRVISHASMINQSARDRRPSIICHEPQLGWSDWSTRISNRLRDACISLDTRFYND